MDVIGIGLLNLDLFWSKFVIITISELVSIAIRIPRSSLTFMHGINNGRSVNTCVNINLACEFCCISI
jgi:hypothetical protein